MIGPLGFAEQVLAILGGVSLVFALIIGILLVAFKKRPQRPGWHAQRPPAPAPAPAPVPRPEAWAGTWNAQVQAPGGLGLGRTFGTFHLVRGVLSFVPDGAPEALWWTPCTHLMVGRRSFFALDGADLSLVGPMGEWHCSVSEEHINRFSRNTAKDFRERRYAEQFVALLASHGARVSG